MPEHGPKKDQSGQFNIGTMLQFIRRTRYRNNHFISRLSSRKSDIAVAKPLPEDNSSTNRCYFAIITITIT